MRELCWIELATEAPPTNESDLLMSDEEFDAEVAEAAQGNWEKLELDALPDDWMTSSIEDLRDA